MLTQLSNLIPNTTYDIIAGGMEEGDPYLGWYILCLETPQWIHPRNIPYGVLTPVYTIHQETIVNTSLYPVSLRKLTQVQLNRHWNSMASMAVSLNLD